MRFPPAFLDEIRARVPISDVIGRRVSWDRRKTQARRGDYWACCPFHGEKTPSFHCEDSKGRYHCFGCGVSGDHFRFLTELEGMSFPEAVESLAGEAGLPMPERDPEAEKREQARASVLDALAHAARFFQTELQGQEGARARAYLRDRGLTPATQKAFGIGYAPASRNRLKEYLAARGVGRAEIEASGLVISGEDIPVSYDRFRDRIMFPITDTREAVIAFGGRAMSDGAQAKYLNSPDADHFHKGQVLFNLARARRGARQSGTLIVGEGYMDVIALAQAGFDHAVAPLGTALTENQLEILWRSAGEPILCFDGDEAGLKAAHRVAERALPGLKPGRSLRFALLPQGKDPDDILREEGREAFDAVLAQARPLADLVWSRETAAGGFDTPERRAELDKRLKGLFRQIGDEDVRRFYLQDAQERLNAFFGPTPSGGSSRGSSQGRRGGYGQNGGYRGRGGAEAGKAGARRPVSEGLARSSLARNARTGDASLREIAIVLGFVNHPSLLDEAFDYFADLELASGDLRMLQTAVLDAVVEAGSLGRDSLLASLEKRKARPAFDALEDKARRVRLWPVLAGADAADAREAVKQALYLHRRSRELKAELRSAEHALGDEGDEAAFERLMDVKRELARVNGTEALIEGFGILSGRAIKAI